SGRWHGDDPDASGCAAQRGDVTQSLLLFASALLLLASCTTETAVRKPSAPASSPTAPATTAPATTTTPTPPPAKPPATSPSGALRPEVSAAEEQRLVESTRQSIGDVTKAMSELEKRSLKAPQQESLRTAKEFLVQAREALDQRDYQRAANLASKARALTDDLASATKYLVRGSFFTFTAGSGRPAWPRRVGFSASWRTTRPSRRQARRLLQPAQEP